VPVLRVGKGVEFRLMREISRIGLLPGWVLQMGRWAKAVWMRRANTKREIGRRGEFFVFHRGRNHALNDGRVLLLAMNRTWIETCFEYVYMWKLGILITALTCWGPMHVNVPSRCRRAISLHAAYICSFCLNHFRRTRTLAELGFDKDGRTQDGDSRRCMGLYRWACSESFGETFTLHFSARKRLFIDAVVSNGSATSHFRVILIVAAWDC
jgi:hypothetical protein